MPAAAVIPAPIAYIKVVVVKKLVVGSRRPGAGLNAFMTGPLWPCTIARGRRVLFTECPPALAGLL